MDGMTFPIPLPVILKDEKEFAEEEAWAQYQKETLELQEAALEQQIESNQKGNVFALDQLDLLGEIADKPTIKKEKEKQIKFWDKIFKGKIFESTLKGIKGIASSLGGGLFDTLIGLMMWAFIDPNGSLMISLINIFVSLSVMVIRMFAKMIPVVLKMILKVLPVIIKALVEIVNTIIDVLPEIIDALVVLLPLIFNTLAKAIPQIISRLMDGVILVMSKLKDKFPMLKTLFEFIERLAISIKNLFDPNSKLGIKERLFNFVKDLLIIIGEALWAGLVALGNLIYDYLVDLIGEDAMSALKKFGIGLGILLGAILAIATAPIAIVGALFYFWDDIAELFSKGYNWFLDNAIDMLMIGMRLLMLPFTWPVEAGWYIYKNWEKIKKKLMEGLKAFQQAFPNVSKWVSDLFSNIKVPNLSDVIFNAFNTALLGIPGLLRRAFSNIPGAETIRKGFEALEKWFKTTIFYAALKKAGMVGGDDEKPKTQFEKIFTNMDAYGSSEVEKAKEKFKDSSIDSETLKQVILGADVKKLGLSVEGQQELTKAISDLKQSVGGEAEFKKIQQQISTSKNDEELSKAIYKLAAQTPFQNVIGSLSNATVSKSGKRGG